ncbi:MAG: TonB-dependent receptor [Burkholderiaceae bacterium]
MNSRAPIFRSVLRNPVNLAVLALLAGASSVHAQGAAQPVPAASAAAASRDDAVQEVTVTATKRTTTLQSTPLAVTPINAAELDKEHVQTVEDVVHLVPSFQATSEGDHGVITMTLRGIGNDSAKTEYADPEVALFVDGIYAPRAEGAAALLFDMDGIEVLRGPQGTLWGRNSTVGAVNMKTAKAEIGSNFGNFEAGLGNYNRLGARGAFNIGISDTFAIRAAFVHEQHDGYVSYQKPPTISLADQETAAAPAIKAYNDAHPNSPQLSFRPLDPNSFVQGGPKYDAQDQTAERISFLWKPMRNLSWNASYEHFEDHGTPNMNLMQDPRPGESFWSALISVAPYLDRSVNTLRSHVSWDLSDYLNLNYTAGYSRYSGSEDFDQSGGAQVPTSFTTNGKVQEDRTDWSHYKNYSHELQLQSNGSHELDWILGLYYAAEDNGIRFDIPITDGTTQGTINWQGAFIQPKETVNSQAVFGQATWNIGDSLHLTGGARFTHDDRKNEGGVNWGWQGKDGSVPLRIDADTDPATLGAAAFSPTHNDGHYTGSKTTWLARANYDLSKNAMVYASVSTGYKSGGLQDGGYHYGPETLTNYEVGSKNTFLDGKVHFNNSLYYEDFKDFQFSAPVTNPDGSHGLATSNAQGAKVYGFETELSAALSKNDTVSISGAYLHTRLGYLLAGSNDYSLPACTESTIISTCLNVTGHKLPHSPSFSGTLMYEHDFRFASGSKLSPRVTLHYEGRSTLSVFDLGPQDEQKAYTRTDLGLRYQDAKDWYVDAFVRNVENGKVRTNAGNSFGAWESQYLPPRTFGVNAGFNF